MIAAPGSAADIVPRAHGRLCAPNDRRRMAVGSWLGLLVAALLIAGCDSRRASREDCTAILERIVDLELEARGYRDPVLAARRRSELRDKLADELSACEGRRMPAAALDCVERATTSGEVSHCLH